MPKIPETLERTNYRLGNKRTSGKVRDNYDLGDKILIVTTDRISSDDVVMRQGVPMKGNILNAMSVLWFKKLRDIIPNHFITDDVAAYPATCQRFATELAGRSMLVKKAKPLPLECVVRGNITGSAWKEYLGSGTVCGIRLPGGLLESQELEEPIFTPATKAEQGFHDENISFERLVEIVGFDLAHQLKAASLRLYVNADILAKKAGIIIADTKMEYGMLDGELILIDELLTPDSSRFWPLTDYQPGRPQKSFDKQFLRDYLSSTGWNKQPPAPELPAWVIEKTMEKYQEACSRLFSVLN